MRAFWRIAHTIATRARVRWNGTDARIPPVRAIAEIDDAKLAYAPSDWLRERSRVREQTLLHFERLVLDVSCFLPGQFCQ